MNRASRQFRYSEIAQACYFVIMNNGRKPEIDLTFLTSPARML